MATQDSNPFGGAAGSTGGMFGGGMWGGGGGMSYGMPPQQGYGGYGSYGGFGGGYGGFGGGMPYGGGYGAPSPYGAPGGYGSPYGGQQGYGGGYSPYGMPQGYGGYGMQQPSPYGGYGGGYSPYGMPSQYGPQPSYGMPQQQTMAAPQAMAATVDGGTADAGTAGDAPASASETGGTAEERFFNIGGSTTQTNRFDPWGPQQEQLRRYLTGTTGRIVNGKAEEISAEGLPTTGAMSELYKQQQAGPLGFDPQSEAALLRMQQMSTGANPMVDAATGATQNIASGQANIGTGGMFQSLYGNPGIRNADQYSQMIGQNAVGNQSQYEQAVRNQLPPGAYEALYYNTGIDPAQYSNMYYNPQGIDTSQMQELYGGSRAPGSLTGGAFGQVARGDLINGNPYREQAIQQAIGDTADQVKATMSSRGRYGSDAYGDAMGKALGQVATQARMAGYDTDTANMMAAAQARSGEALSKQGIGLQAAQSTLGAQGQNWQNRLAALQGLTGAQTAQANTRLGAAAGQFNVLNQNVQNQLAAAQGISGLQGTNAAQRLAQIQGLTGVQGQNWQDQLAAAQGLTGINSQDIQNRMAAAGMAPAMQGLRYDDINRQLQAGATREAMAQQQRNYGWDTLRQFQGLVGGVPGSAGTSKGTEQRPWWESALGAAGVLGGMWGAGAPTV